MRISDWSSDVCSSDLATLGVGQELVTPARGDLDLPVLHAHQFQAEPLVEGIDRQPFLKALERDLRLFRGSSVCCHGVIRSARRGMTSAANHSIWRVRCSYGPIMSRMTCRQPAA